MTLNPRNPYVKVQEPSYPSLTKVIDRMRKEFQDYYDLASPAVIDEATFARVRAIAHKILEEEMALDPYLRGTRIRVTQIGGQINIMLNTAPRMI